MLQPTRFRSELKNLCFLAVLAALMIVLQMAMSGIPNVEPVTLLVILTACYFGPRALLAVAVFVLAQGMIYGFHIWWINYLYVWPILVLITLLLRRWSHPLLWTVVAGFYGLLFGTLCSIPYFITGGMGAGIAYIIQGIPYDLAHCIGNVVLVGLLFKPLDFVMQRILK